jgi:hypothetical protein
MRTRRLVFSLTQKLKRLAWSNKAALWIATRVVDASYILTRRFRRGAIRAGGDDAPPELHPLRRFWAEFSGIAGSFWDGAIVTWDVLFRYQAEAEIAGDLLEIGVLKGRSAVLLALHARPGETLALVDPALRLEATDMVERARPGPNLYLRMRSQELGNDTRLGALEGRCRWVHIDGEHSGPAVDNDLDIAARLLAPEGVICLDDFFTPAYPQITRAAFTWLAARGGAFILFLTGFNKGYICRAHAALDYLRFTRDRMLMEFERRDFGNVTVWKTTEPADMNCFGITPRYQEHRCKGPDWAPDTIPL